MPVSEQLLKLESQRGMLQILMFLLKNGESNYSTIKDGTASATQTIRRALSNAVELDLVKLRTISGAPTKYYSLTEKGFKTAQKIKEIEKILEE